MFQSMSKERRNIHEAAAMVTLEDSKSTCWVIYSVAAIFPEVPVVKSAACRFHAVWSLVAELDMEVGRERERECVFQHSPFRDRSIEDTQVFVVSQINPRVGGRLLILEEAKGFWCHCRPGTQATTHTHAQTLLFPKVVWPWQSLSPLVGPPFFDASPRLRLPPTPRQETAAAVAPEATEPRLIFLLAVETTQAQDFQVARTPNLTEPGAPRRGDRMGHTGGRQ